jgi:hypothetical protein
MLIKLWNRIFGKKKSNNTIEIYQNYGTGIASHETLDVCKCIGCRKGISLFIRDKDKFAHIDLWGGIHFPCDNQNIHEFIKNNENRGTYIPNDASSDFFSTQELWWDDIVTLAQDVFGESGAVDFFNEGESKDNRNWNLPNEQIEGKLLNSASEKNIQVTQDQYPNLIKYQP